VAISRAKREAVHEVVTDVERELGEVEQAALDAPFPEPAAFAEFTE
jgi:hypothetical protein